MDTECRAPNGVVNNLLAESTATTITIQWEAIEPLSRRGNVTYYVIELFRHSHQWEEVIMNEGRWYYFDTPELTFTLDPMPNDTLFDIRVLGVTKEGQGPVCELVRIRTKENVPSVYPLEVEGQETSSSSLLIKWDAVPREYHQGNLLGYIIKYQYVEVEGFSFRGGSLNGTVQTQGMDVTEVEIQGLHLYTNYTIQIAGYTITGEGPWSPTIVVSTGIFYDGNLTEWTQWGNCDKSCGLGVSMRQRWCTNPPPLYGGYDCEGETMETLPCNDIPCPGFYLAKVGQSCADLCSEVGNDFACIRLLNTYDRIQPFFEAIDANDYTQLSNIDCTPHPQTDDYQKASDPSYEISANRCRGYKNLTLIDCHAVGGSQDRRLCKCVDKDSASYTEWANWGVCSKECGGGRYQRYRRCLMSSCPGSNIDVNDCNVEPCPVDGSWGQWTEWSDCTTTCDFGRRIRTRKCDSPVALYGGKECAGVNEDSVSGCNPQPCPIHGHWSAWGLIEQCKQPCSNSRNAIKRRFCDLPAPKYGGDYCVGNDTRYIPCSSTPCKSVDVNYYVRLVDEHWDFMMYRMDDPNTLLLMDNLRSNISLVFQNNTDYGEIDNQVGVTFHNFEKGSVLANFTVSFQMVHYAESLILQDAIDNNGLLAEMPVELKNITTEDVPSQPPNNIVCKSYTSTTINVTWDHSFKTNQSGYVEEHYLYYIFIRNIDDDSLWDNEGTPDNSTQIIGLKPGTLYGIRVLVSSTAGMGLASKEIEVRTVAGAPTVSPYPCEMQTLDSYTIFFSWTAIPQSQVPGRFLGYQIKYKQYTNNDTTIVNVDAQSEQRTINAFKAFTWYWVEITGYSNGGIGPPCLPFVFRTPEGAPGAPPPNALVNDQFSTHQLNISWSALPPEYHNGDLVGYRFFYFMVRQAGVELAGRQTKILIDVDKFTMSYLIGGLESYTEYEIHLYAYSRYGDGPPIVLKGSTCKCPKAIFTNYYNSNPFMQADQIRQTYTGLFPQLLSQIVDSVCTGCATPTTTYYNLSMDGREPLKDDVNSAIANIDDTTHFTFPIFGQLFIKTYSGYPFVGIVQSQGTAMIVHQPKIVSVGFMRIFTAVVNAKSVLAISMLLMCVVGWFLWFSEQSSSNSDMTIQDALRGASEGFWIAFVTMTTVGYGDFVPTTELSKVVLAVWSLTGLVLIGIFGGVVSSGLSVVALNDDIKIYGSTVATIKDSFEYRKAIQLFGKIDPNKNYTGILDIMAAVESGEVQIGLIDASFALGYEALMEEKSLRIYKVLDYNAGYGMVLAGDAAKLESDVRSYTTSNQAYISRFMEKEVGLLQPTLIEVEELLFTPEEANFTFITLTGVFFALVFVGYLYWFFCRKTKIQVQPEETSSTRLAKMTSLVKFSENFCTKFEASIEEMSSKNQKELIELNFLHQNYKRLMNRLDLYKQHEEFEKKSKKKLARAIRKKQFDRIIESTYDKNN
uniref:Fibronectin type-III domain-containing protein n=1 Tax=Clytia hemisphaerica TaxID=252671 RepID=A0A7M5X9R1_9CNID